MDGDPTKHLDVPKNIIFFVISASRWSARIDHADLRSSRPILSADAFSLDWMTASMTVSNFQLKPQRFRTLFVPYCPPRGAGDTQPEFQLENHFPPLNSPQNPTKSPKAHPPRLRARPDHFFDDLRFPLKELSTHQHAHKPSISSKALYLFIAILAPQLVVERSKSKKTPTRCQMRALAQSSLCRCPRPPWDWPSSYRDTWW